MLSRVHAVNPRSISRYHKHYISWHSLRYEKGRLRRAGLRPSRETGHEIVIRDDNDDTGGACVVFICRNCS